MNFRSLRSASILSLLLSTFSSCVMPVAYSPYQAGYTGYPHRYYRYQTVPRSSQWSSNRPRRSQSEAFRLAANGHIEAAHAAVARGAGTDDDVRRGQNVYRNNQMIAAGVAGVIGVAIVAEAMSGGSGQQSDDSQGYYDDRPFKHTENEAAKAAGRELPHPEVSH